MKYKEQGIGKGREGNGRGRKGEGRGKWRMTRSSRCELPPVYGKDPKC